MTRAVVLGALLGLSVAVTATLVLNPSPEIGNSGTRLVSDLVRDTGLPPWVSGPATWEVLLNVALFVPGVLLARLLWPRGPAGLWLLGVAGVSICVELAQALFLDQRTPSLVDVLANTAGGAVGLALGRSLGRVRAD